MVSHTRLFFKQPSHRFAFVHKDANIAFRLSQGQGAFQRCAGVREVSLRLKREGLQQQDLDGAAQPAAGFCRLQEMPQQPGSLVKGTSLPSVFTGSDEHPGQREVLELAQVADVISHREALARAPISGLRPACPA